MTRPNYVQVTDTRGTWDGWTLTVAESDQFQNTSGEKLTGAELSFSKGYTDGTTAAKPGYINNTNFVVSTAASKILGAGPNQGMGTWVYGLGANADYQENGCLLYTSAYLSQLSTSKSASISAQNAKKTDASSENTAQSTTTSSN